MRSFILILVFFSPKFDFAQAKLDSIFSVDACECLTNRPDPSIDSMAGCFEKAIQKNMELVIKETRKRYKTATYEAGYKFAQEICSRITISMIGSCQAYYEFMDTLRSRNTFRLDKDSIASVLLKISQTDPKTWNKKFLTQRGVLYFILSDFDRAMTDFDMAISNYPNASECIFYKAWIFELQQKYDDAIALYTQLASSTKEHHYEIMAAIARRKKNGL